MLKSLTNFIFKAGAGVTWAKNGNTCQLSLFINMETRVHPSIEWKITHGVPWIFYAFSKHLVKDRVVVEGWMNGLGYNYLTAPYEEYKHT